VPSGAPAWGPVFKGRPLRWTPYYVSDTLRNRATIGEYTPHTRKLINGAKQRVPDGEPIMYYPPVVPLSLFQKVQAARMAFAQSKFGESLNAGKDLHSDKNLFKKLVWDANNDAPMVYRYGTHHPCLVTTHRKSLRQRKISYPKSGNGGNRNGANDSASDYSHRSAMDLPGENPLIRKCLRVSERRDFRPLHSRF
jgi:hypothetical protein